MLDVVILNHSEYCVFDTAHFYLLPRSKLPIIEPDRIYAGISQIWAWSGQIQVELSRYDSVDLRNIR